MIKNERQYQVTKKQIRNFEEALARVRSQQFEEGTDDYLFQQIDIGGLTSQLEDLRAEALDYERLRSTQPAVINVDSFDELPQALIAARIASGMTQRALAERLGIKEQQVQRYEATDYASASLQRVSEVVHALDVAVREEVLLPAPNVSLPVLFRRLQEIGLDKDLIVRRIVPPLVRARLEQAEDADGSRTNLALHAASVIGRVFGFSPTAIFGDDVLHLDPAAVGAARFKVTAGANERRLAAYTVYAHTLAGLLLRATPDLERRPAPTDPARFRAAVIAAYGSFDFEHTLRYAWDLGIAVLPLNDAGAFHGAFWRKGGRNVIVLKQRTASSSRWLLDLLHEIRHAGQEPGQSELAIVEEGETLRGRKAAPEEREAVRFAVEAIMDGRAEKLAEISAVEAGGAVERLKTVVPKVAERNRIDVGALADYMAYRLSFEEPSVNWWGTATNLQPQDMDPWRTARDVLLERVDLGRLERFDRELLMRALAEPEV